jgi:dephospho-CoA kinase
MRPGLRPIARAIAPPILPRDMLLRRRPAHVRDRRAEGRPSSPTGPSGRRPRRARGPWKHGPIPVVGLVGEIGAGKSRVAERLAARGAFVLDADAVGHALLSQRPVRERVVARFGEGILDRSADAGEGPPPIDRRALGAIVFADPAALRDLEAILHPRMRRTFERAIAREVRRGRAGAVVLDAAILLEKGWDDLCDRVVFVEAPRDERLARLEAQRGWTDEVLQARERVQWPPERKRARADAVVVNASGLDALAAEVDRLRETVLKPPRAPRRP